MKIIACTALAAFFVAIALAEELRGTETRRSLKRRTRYPTKFPTAVPTQSPVSWEYGSTLQLSEDCASNTECLSFGDPVVLSMDGVETRVSCGSGSDTTLLMAYGFAVDVTCAGSPQNANLGWIQKLTIRQDNNVVHEHDAYECELMEAADADLQRQTSWFARLKSYELFNPSQMKQLFVNVGCFKRNGISMVGSHGIQNTIMNVHVKLKNYQSTATNALSILAAAKNDGVSGKCLPYETIDVATFNVQVLSSSARADYCKKVGLELGNACSMESSANSEDCLLCYPDGNPFDDIGCHYCVLSTQTNPACSVNEDCCSSSCVNNKCTPETDIDQVPPACCDKTKTCYKRTEPSSPNDGYCKKCFEATETCGTDRECCAGLTCGPNNKCIPESNIETCSCDALCAAVSDPVVRGFAFYAKDVVGGMNTLYDSSAAGGVAITYDTVLNSASGGEWITKVYVDGSLFFSTLDCPAYTLNSLPRCRKGNCPNKRDKPSAGILTLANDQNVLLNGVWPFTTKNDVKLEIHCVSKRAINTGASGHEYSRLDVYVNKATTFQKSSSVNANEQNVFVYNELNAGNSGLCLEPFSSNVLAIQNIGDDSIGSWIKSDKIDPGSCTCNTEGDTVRR